MATSCSDTALHSLLSVFLSSLHPIFLNLFVKNRELTPLNLYKACVEDNVSAIKPKKRCVTVLLSKDAVTHNLGGQNTVGDSITSKPETEPRPGKLRNTAYVGETVFGAAKGSGPGKRGFAFQMGKQSFQLSFQGFDFSCQSRIAAFWIPVGFILANRSCRINTQRFSV